MARHRTFECTFCTAKQGVLSLWTWCENIERRDTPTIVQMQNWIIYFGKKPFSNPLCKWNMWHRMCKVHKSLNSPFESQRGYKIERNAPPSKKTPGQLGLKPKGHTTRSKLTSSCFSKGFYHQRPHIYSIGNSMNKLPIENWWVCRIFKTQKRKRNICLTINVWIHFQK